MTRKTPQEVAASVRQRLQNIPGLRHDFQYVLIRYATERLLYRLSASPHRGRFVLSGGLGPPTLLRRRAGYRSRV